MSAMPAWAMISVASGFALDERARARRRSAAGRGRRGSGSARAARRRARRPAPSRSSVASKRCARGCSLIPRAPASRQRVASSIGVSFRSRRTNGIRRPLRALGERERAVVRGAEGGMAVGLVEAEHERARDPVLGHQLLELVVVADHAVDVGAEVEVRVEDVGARGQQLPDLVVVAALEQLERPSPCGNHRELGHLGRVRGPRARRPHLRRHVPLAGAAPRDPAPCPIRSSTSSGRRPAHRGQLDGDPACCRTWTASSSTRSRSSASTSCGAAASLRRRSATRSRSVR